MARIFARGQRIPFTHSFYDSSGDLTQPQEATLRVNYPTSGWPHRGFTEGTTITMTVTTTTVTTASDYLTFKATWNSVVAYPGPVHWSISASDLSLAVKDGEFTLRGNRANLAYSTTVTT
jgi:hypothetical protein